MHIYLPNSIITVIKQCGIAELPQNSNGKKLSNKLESLTPANNSRIKNTQIVFPVEEDELYKELVSQLRQLWITFASAERAIRSQGGMFDPPILQFITNSNGDLSTANCMMIPFRE